MTDDYNRKIEELRLKALKMDAVEVETNTIGGDSVDKLCYEMAKASFNTNKPVKATFNGKEFVIPACTIPSEAIEAWVDQTMHLENRSEEDLKSFIEMDKDGQDYVIHRGDDTSREIINKKVCDTLLQKNPNNADQLDTIQLIDVYFLHWGEEKTPDSLNYQKMMTDSANRYMNGEKTFEPTVYNVSKMNNLQELLDRQGKYSEQEIEARMSQTEVEMMQRVDLKKIDHDIHALNFVDKIAAKHPEEKLATTLHRGILDIKLSKLTELKESNIR